MFTGIIREIGRVRRIRKKGGILSLGITSKDVAAGIAAGDSVAVNGVCLTAVKSGGGVLEFDIMEETARRSTFPSLREGDPVNLEGSMRADGTFGGHFVQGHVDCVGTIRRAGRSGENFSIDIAVPEGFHGLYVDKGSVAVDGVSLTVGRCKDGGFNVYIIPHTLKHSALGKRKAGDMVNVEFDILGKYAVKAQGAGRQVTEKFLEDKGFI